MRRILVAVVAAASLSFSLAGPLNPLWTVLLSLWSEATADIGCGMDPNGCPSDPQPTSDIGCGWDPNGRQCS